MRIAFLTLLCALLLGCAAPKTRDEMLASSVSSTRVCSTELSPGDAVERLQIAWSRCFVSPRSIGIAIVGNTATAYENSRVALSREDVKETSVLVARIASRPLSIPNPLSHSMLLMADIRETKECRAEVVVRAANTHWQKRANETVKWLTDPLLQSPEAECGR